MDSSAGVEHSEAYRRRMLGPSFWLTEISPWKGEQEMALKCKTEGCEKLAQQGKGGMCCTHWREATGTPKLTRGIKPKVVAAAPVPAEREREPLPETPSPVPEPAQAKPDQRKAPQKSDYDRGAFRRNTKQLQIFFHDGDEVLYEAILAAAKANRRQPMQEVLFRLDRDMTANG
jgi:hypothetical protein